MPDGAFQAAMGQKLVTVKFVYIDFSSFTLNC